MKLVDERLLDKFRAAWRCEYCKRQMPSGCDPAHIFSRGAGRVDIAGNLIALCRWCHVKAHAKTEGVRITRQELLEIAARREGVAPEWVEDEVYRIRRT